MENNVKARKLLKSVLATLAADGKQEGHVYKDLLKVKEYLESGKI